MLEELFRRPSQDLSPGFEVILRPGAVIGRFQLLRELGRGGFGIVFEARDSTLGRSVAFKAVRPGHRTAQLDAMLRREAEAAASLQHDNIAALHDFGASEAGPYLVLELLRGETLAQRLARGPLPVGEAVQVAVRVTRALVHAHGEGLLHRDLKLSNVFLTEGGGVKVLDLGLARLFGAAAGIGGTPPYMAPEQWRGEPQDGRTDLFALGVMLHEMLSGRRPYEIRDDRSTALSAGPEPRLEVKGVPERLARLVDRCIAKNAARRPPTARAVLDELVALEQVIDRPSRRRMRRVVALAAAAALLVAAGAALRAWWSRTTAPADMGPQKILVGDFENRTGEGIFDGTLEPALALALEGASFITSYNRREAQKLADLLQIAGTGLGEKRARLVAEREGVPVITAGLVTRSGARYRVAVRALDAFTGKVLVDRSEDGTKAEVLGTVHKLAARVRSAMGDATPEAVQLKEGETFGAASLEAAHAYSSAATLALEGNWDKARERYLEAVQLDPGMARAYSGLAVLEANRSRRSEADRYFKQALVHMDRLSDREKYRTRGAYYLFSRDADKAVEAFEALVKQYPADYAGLANLAMAYLFQAEFPRALETGRRAIAIYPKNVPQRNNVGFFAMYAGSFEEALREQRKVLEANPRFANGYIGLALAQLVAGQRDGAEATWRALETAGDPSAAIEGLADLAVYEGRLTAARELLERGSAADLARNDGDAAARKLAMLAGVHQVRREGAAANAAAERAVAASRDSAILLLAGSVLAAAGEDARAHAIASELEQRIDRASRSYAELVRGAVARRHGRHLEAIARSKAALALIDSWLVRYALARSYFDAGAYPQAHDELERCERRRGEAADVFQDNVPTYRLYAPVQYYLGRTQAALANPAATRTLEAFVAARKGDEDPIVADARKRMVNGHE